MDMIKCENCDGKGYIEMGCYDPDETCENCDGLGVIPKQLTVEEVQEKFDAVYDGNIEKHENSITYKIPSTDLAWDYYLQAYIDMDLIKEGK